MSKQLLFSVTKKDFEIQTFRAGGKGGQNQNARDTGVRLIHKESGARGEARDSRYQAQNKKQAFRRLLETKEWKIWFRIKCGQTVAELDDWMQRMMAEKNLKIEVKRDGHWIEVRNRDIA